MELGEFRLSLYQPGGPMGVFYPVEEVLLKKRSRYQEIMVVRLRGFGKTLVLDGLIQSSEVDEYIYHEALVHPAMLLHPGPRRVLILGGGEGATLREALKHPSVEEAVMVDIDEEVIRVARELLPEWHQGAFDDPRSRVYAMDGFEYVRGAAQRGEKFDVVIMDLTDPYGSEIAAQLYTEEAFRLVKSVLTGDGVVAVQAGNSTLFSKAFQMVMDSVRPVFRYAVEYDVWVPSFSYMNSFILASDRYDPLSLDAAGVDERIRERGLRLRFLNGERYRAMFAFAGLEPVE